MKVIKDKYPFVVFEADGTDKFVDIIGYITNYAGSDISEAEILRILFFQGKIRIEVRYFND